MSSFFKWFVLKHIFVAFWPIACLTEITSLRNSHQNYVISFALNPMTVLILISPNNYILV